MRETIAILLFLLICGCSRAPKCKPLAIGQVISLSSGDATVSEIASNGRSAKLSSGETLACVADNAWTSDEPVALESEDGK